MEEQPDQDIELWYTPDNLYLAQPNLLTAERRSQYVNYGIPLYQAALKGDYEAMMQIHRIYPEGITSSITKHGDIALHIGAAARHTKFTKMIVLLLEPDDLHLQNRMGNTALCLAAASGTVPIAKAMVDKSNFDRELLNMRGNGGLTPLLIAALLGHREMVRYLLPITDLSNPDPINLLSSTIKTDMYDVALDILRERPELAIARDKQQLTPLHILATKSRKRCKAQLGFWRGCCNFFADLNEIKEENPLPPKALQLVQRLWDIVIQEPEVDIFRLIRHPTNLLFDAAKSGNVEFLIILIRSYPDLIWRLDHNRKTIFHIAVEYRQEKVFRLIHDIGAIKELLAVYIDGNHNTMLHFAAQIPSSDVLNRISGPALQMQREIQWFKVVEDILHPELAVSEKLEKETPKALFTKSHEELRKKGEKWMRITAGSYTVVATLIVTMVFAAASKFPIEGIVYQQAYLVLAAFEAISLTDATASILVFLSIVTSRYAEEDFLKSLPFKLLIGLTLLVTAIIAMMMAFFTIFLISFRDKFLWIIGFGLPGLLVIAVVLLLDSFLLVFRMVASRNILYKPLRSRLFEV